MKIISEILYSSNNSIDIYVSETKDSNRTIIYFHGGGIEGGDKKDAYIVDVAKSFAEKGISFVSANYSLYPKAKFPEYIFDAAKAISFVIKNAKKYGLGKEFYVCGSSAGAYIIMMLCLNKTYLETVGVNSNELKGWISDDGQMTDHFNVQKYELGIEPWLQRITEKAPIYYIDNETNFNRLLIIYYNNDMPMRKEQNLLLVSTLRHFKSNADVTLRELVGTHCEGTCKKDKDGEYPFVKETMKWIR